MGFIGADPALGRLDPFLDLGQERVRDPGPRRRFCDRSPGVTGRDVPGNSMVRAARELRGGAQRSGQIIGSKNFHDFSVMLHTGPLPGTTFGATRHRHQIPGRGPRRLRRGRFSKEVGRSHGHRWAILLAASGQFRGRLLRKLASRGSVRRSDNDVVSELAELLKSAGFQSVWIEPRIVVRAKFLETLAIAKHVSDRVQYGVLQSDDGLHWATPSSDSSILCC